MTIICYLGVNCDYLAMIGGGGVENFLCSDGFAKIVHKLRMIDKCNTIPDRLAIVEYH